MSARGLLITIEGIDGTGKTTLATELVKALSIKGIDVCLLREPGGVEASERVRELVKDPALIVGPRAEALLYAAARAQLVDEAIEPRLAAGRTVMLDRFVDSSLAYQGAGRELGIEAIRSLNHFATGGLTADRTLLLILDPEVAHVRASGRQDAPDRLELAGREFFERAHDAYLELARTDPDRIRLLDASNPPEQVLKEALSALEGLF
jgi:dTMP kinase